MKVSHEYKQAPDVDFCNVLLLISPEVARNMCPEYITRRLPTEYPQYLNPAAKQPELLAQYWAPLLVQRRLCDHMFMENNKYVAKDEAGMQSSMLKIFINVFPKELGDLIVDSQEKSAKRPRDGDEPLATGDVPAGTEAESTAVDANDPFAVLGKVDIDFAAFDGALDDELVQEGKQPASDNSKQERAAQLIDQELVDDARLLLARIWPERFLDVLPRAVAKAFREKLVGWFATMRDSKVYVRFCSAAKLFNEQLIKFATFRATHSQTMLDFEQFASLTDEAYAKTISVQGRPREISEIELEWNKNVSKTSLVQLRLIQNVFKKLHEEFSVRIRGEHAAKFSELETRSVISIGRVVYFVKGLSLAALQVASAEGVKAPVRLVVLQNA